MRISVVLLSLDDLAAANAPDDLAATNAPKKRLYFCAELRLSGCSRCWQLYLRWKRQRQKVVADADSSICVGRDKGKRNSKPRAEAEVWFAGDTPTKHQPSRRFMQWYKNAPVIEAQIIIGTHLGDKVYIRKIIMSPSDTKWLFVMKRRQYPLSVCFAKVSLALSRVTNRGGLKVLIDDNSAQAKTVRRISYTKRF